MYIVTELSYRLLSVPPKIFLTNSPQSAAIQSELSLTCQSSGDPSPVIQWFKPNGQPILSNHAYVQSDDMLKIVSANQSDIGEWTCRYCNLLGCDAQTVIVFSKGKLI